MAKKSKRELKKERELKHCREVDTLEAILEAWILQTENPLSVIVAINNVFHHGEIVEKCGGNVSGNNLNDLYIGIDTSIAAVTAMMK